jgi:hypothetical protein
MRGEFIGVWSETWKGIWSPLTKHREAPGEIFSDLYRDLVPEPKPPAPPPTPSDFDDNGELTRREDIEARSLYEEATRTHAIDRARYEEAVNNGKSAKSEFRSALSSMVKTESDAILILEMSFSVLNDYNLDVIGNRFFTLVDRFISKYSLRYDLRRPFTIHPTLTGIFAHLVRDLKEATSRDAALHSLMLEFEETVRDLRSDRSSGKIKSCIQKQVNLLEAIGQRHPGVTSNTLGGICDQVGTWPHRKVKDAMKDLYSFTCDYPGIRHGGTSGNQIRAIEMRDLVSVSVVLAGFSPYLTDLISSDDIYRRS